MNTNDDGHTQPRGTPFDRFTFLHDQNMREQEMYWSRFYSFATLSAGAFLLATSTEFDKITIAVLGLALATAWMLTQIVGLGYVNRTKLVFHEKRKELGFFYSYGKGISEKDDPDNPPGLLKYPLLTASSIGLIVSIGVLLFWGARLVSLGLARS